jgi:hypothetical protein
LVNNCESPVAPYRAFILPPDFSHLRAKCGHRPKRRRIPKSFFPTFASNS